MPDFPTTLLHIIKKKFGSTIAISFGVIVIAILIYLNFKTNGTTVIVNTEAKTEDLDEQKQVFLNPDTTEEQEFDPNSWTISTFDLSEDEQGYLCFDSKRYLLASIYSKQIVPLNYNFETEIRLKKVDQTILAPTFSLTYRKNKVNRDRDKEYRINFFDGGDPKSIRLYDSLSNEGVDQFYLTKSPNFNFPVKISITSAYVPLEESKMKLSFDILYKDSTGNKIHDNNHFDVTIYDLDLHDIEGEIGLGVKKGICFKPSTYSFQFD